MGRGRVGEWPAALPPGGPPAAAPMWFCERAAWLQGLRGCSAVQAGWGHRKGITPYPVSPSSWGTPREGPSGPHEIFRLKDLPSAPEILLSCSLVSYLLKTPGQGCYACWSPWQSRVRVRPPSQPPSQHLSLCPLWINGLGDLTFCGGLLQFLKGLNLAGLLMWLLVGGEGGASELGAWAGPGTSRTAQGSRGSPKGGGGGA